MATDQSKIADDWEDIVDEMCSVVSLPSEEEDNDAVLIPRRTTPTRETDDNKSASIMPLLDPADVPATDRALILASAPALASVSTPAPGPTPVSAPTPIHKRARRPPSELIQPLLGRPRDENYILSGELPPRLEPDPTPQYGSKPTPRSRVSSDNDSDRVDSALLLAKLRSIGRLVDQCPQQSCFRNDSQLFGSLLALTSQLRHKFNILETILFGYAEHFSNAIASPSAREVPLDPSLSLWLDAVCDQTEIVLDVLTDNTRDSWQVKSEIEHLDSLGRNLDEFLPIIQGDFNEFKNQHMSTVAPSATLPSP